MERGWEQLSTVRMVLAGVVALTHWVAIFWRPFGLVGDDAVAALSFAAQHSVNGFFVISGMVITASLVSLRSKGDGLFIEFMRRRIWRIYPPLLFSVAVCVLIALRLQDLGLLAYSGAHAAYRQSFNYLNELGGVVTALVTFGLAGGLYTTSNGPLWSLTLEMQAYVVVGMLAQVVFAKSIATRLVAVLGVYVLYRIMRAHQLADYEMAAFVCFAVGSLLGLARVRLPRLLPVLRFECSYSLFILHYPIFLFVFFWLCQGDPSIMRVAAASGLGLLLAAGATIFSGLFIESFRVARPPIGTSETGERARLGATSIRPAE